MSSSVVFDELQEIVPSLVNMTNVLGVPELGVALALANALVKAVESELSSRSVTPEQAKASIDAATQAAIAAKFP